MVSSSQSVHKLNCTSAVIDSRYIKVYLRWLVEIHYHMICKLGLWMKKSVIINLELLW